MTVAELKVAKVAKAPRAAVLVVAAEAMVAKAEVIRRRGTIRDLHLRRETRTRVPGEPSAVRP
jgi:hypothetical protein